MPKQKWANILKKIKMASRFTIEFETPNGVEDFTKGIIIGKKVLFLENPLDLYEDEVLEQNFDELFKDKCENREKTVEECKEEGYRILEYYYDVDHFDDRFLSNEGRLSDEDLELVLDWVEELLGFGLSQDFRDIFIDSYNRKGTKYLFWTE